MKRTRPLLAAITICLIAGAACATPRSAGGVPTQAVASRPTSELPTQAAAPLLVTDVPAQAVAAAPQLGGCAIFPPDNVWNVPIDKLPVHPDSNAYIANINIDETTVHPDFGSFQYGYFGIPYNVVPQNQPKVAVTFEYDDESDDGPYPIPPNPLIEGGPDSDGDRHILMVEQGTCKLYETFASYPNGNGTWRAGSGAIFDLNSNALREDGWTSADAAGLPILPGLARYDEVAAGAINHALRFTAWCTADAYVWPARHKAVPDSCDDTPPPAGTKPPPMGLRFRLKAGFDISGFKPQTRVILTALKKYGMILADNGSSWYISGEPNANWIDDDLVDDLRQVRGSDFEAVDESSLQLNPDSGQVNPAAIAQDSKHVMPGGADQGQQVTYTIQVIGDGSAVALSDPLPAGVTFVNNSLTTTGGAPANHNGGTISWSGAPAFLSIVTITFAATVNASQSLPIVNTATITRGSAQKNLAAVLIANPIRMFLPVTRR
jgi:uncharacterized repeat protein (TIGR01451 family)